MNRLTDKDFSFKCPMSWDEMETTDKGKFCSKCSKEVFDLTDFSTDEVRALQEKHGSICGSIRIAQAAVVALSLSAAACQKSVRTTGAPLPPPAQNKTTKLIQPNSSAGNKGETCPPKSDSPEERPLNEADPFLPGHNEPMILGKIQIRPDLDQEEENLGPRIDI